MLPEDGGRRTAAASFATSAPRTLAEQLDDDACAARPRNAGAARPQSAGAAPAPAGGGGRAAYQAMLARDVDAGRGAGAAQFHSKPLVPMDQKRCATP